MTISSLPPALWFYLGAIVALFLPRPFKQAALLLTPVVSFALCLSTFGQEGLAEAWTIPFAAGSGLELQLYSVERISFLFICIFHVIAGIGVVFGLHVDDDMQHVASLVYAGSALGVVCAGDLLTVFLYWEVMAVSSTFLVWARRTERARSAGLRYLLMQLVSGLLLLAGALLVLHDTGTLAVTELAGEDGTGRSTVGYWLIFLGVGLKCAFPGLHTWLTDAYPEATPTGTVWLSAFTTKTAVYLLARLFPGEPSLIVIGGVMAAFPIFYAVIENDLRRVLAYSLINQVGFMVVGVGIGTAVAINGALAHAFNDILFKGLLFMSMGAVLYRTGKIGGSELGGLHRTMPWTCLFCCVGAASISAFPLFSGFASKSMVMYAASHGGMLFLWLVLLFASAGVFHHAGIKIPYFAFFAHDSGARPKEAPWNMLLAMGVTAVLCIAIGTFPHRTVYPLLPVDTGYEPYDVTHVLTQLQILFFSALAFTLLMLTRVYPPELPSVNLDADWIVRRVVRFFLWIVRVPIVGILGLWAKLLEEWIPAQLGRHFSPPARARETTVAEIEMVDRTHRPVGFQPEETVERTTYERVPAGLAIALATLLFVLLLSLSYWTA